MAEVTQAESLPDELVVRARRGDRAAFVLLVDDCAAALRRIALSRLRDQQALVSVEDALQDTALNAWSSLALLRHESRAGFRAWLMMIHYASIARLLRRELAAKRNPVPGQEKIRAEPASGSAPAAAPPGREPSPSEPVRMDELRNRLLNALEKLPDVQRRVVRLRFLEECSYEELQRETGLSPGAIQGHLRRGLARLREQSGMDLKGLLTSFDGS